MTFLVIVLNVQANLQN